MVEILHALQALRYRRRPRARAALGRVGDRDRTVLEQHGIDGFHRGGWLWTATNVAQVDAWKDTVEKIAAAGAAPYELLDRNQVAERSGSPVHLAGVLERSAGIVQPALLARGRRRPPGAPE